MYYKYFNYKLIKLHMHQHRNMGATTPRMRHSVCLPSSPYIRWPHLTQMLCACHTHIVMLIIMLAVVLVAMLVVMVVVMLAVLLTVVLAVVLVTMLAVVLAVMLVAMLAVVLAVVPAWSWCLVLSCPVPSFQGIGRCLLEMGSDGAAGRAVERW
jgi:hypothetical protein